jgi:hypothetical protein
MRAISIGAAPIGGLEKFYEELDRLTIPELGCILRFDIIPWGNERKQINMAIASGEYDFIPGGNFSDYRSMAYRNAFLDINEYLHLVPALVEHYNLTGVDILKQSEIDGNLYGIPQYGMPGLVNVFEGFFYREDLRKEWGVQPVTSFETLEAYLYRAKEDPRYANYPLITDNRVWTSLWYMLASGKYLEIISVTETPYAVVRVDDIYTPISRMETPEFEHVLSIVKKWYDDGILESDILAFSDNEGQRAMELMKADRKPCETNAPLWAINNWYIADLYDANPLWEFEFYDYTMHTSPAYIKSAASNTVISISSKTKYPEAAIMLLEKLHTDQRYYDLLVYGVRGENYYLNEDGIYFDGILRENRLSGWTGAADEFMSYFYVGSQHKQWNEVYNREIRNAIELTTGAPAFPFDGFFLNVTGLMEYVEKMDEVKSKYFQPLLCGVSNDLSGDYGTAIKMLRETGISGYLSEVERQLQVLRND